MGARKAVAGSPAGEWNGRSLRQVDVEWEETLGAQGTGGLLRPGGAVRDVLQIHLLQILTLLAMELPAGRTDGELSAARLDPLYSVRGSSPVESPPGPDEPTTPPGR